MKHRSDSYLVEVAKATSDRAVFDELFGRHHHKLRAFMLTKVNESVVDDVLQETYIKAFINVRKFEGKSAFSTWLFSIAINEYKLLVRRRSTYEKLISLLGASKREASEHKDHDVLIDFDKRANLLTSQQYEMMILSLVFGYSHGEIARFCDVPLGSVKTYLAQATRKTKVNDER